MKLVDEVLVAAIEVIRAWDEKDYLKDSIEQLRSALEKLKGLM
jgi:hypothetical protein